MSFQLILASVEPALDKAWMRHFDQEDNVEVQMGNILDLDCDAVVSPANSFGFMDGGIDALYMDYFGSEIQLGVRREIMDRHGGELLVGDAAVVETGDDAIPYLIAAPTMRVPMKLGNTVNPYLAARAVFRLIRYGEFASGSDKGRAVNERIERVAMPGLGTGVGGVGPNTCAHQVRQAYDDVVLDRYVMPRSWAEASERHQLLYTDRPVRLQY
jgi:O-acetyl-ADP-ribose deacetylase (regulator of RNase III)